MKFSFLLMLTILTCILFIHYNEIKFSKNGRYRLLSIFLYLISMCVIATFLSYLLLLHDKMVIFRSHHYIVTIR